MVYVNVNGNGIDSQNIFVMNVSAQIMITKKKKLLAAFNVIMMSSKFSLSCYVAHNVFTGAMTLTLLTNGVKIFLERCQGILI